MLDAQVYSRRLVDSESLHYKFGRSILVHDATSHSTMTFSSGKTSPVDHAELCFNYIDTEYIPPTFILTPTLLNHLVLRASFGKLKQPFILGI